MKCDAKIVCTYTYTAYTQTAFSKRKVPYFIHPSINLFHPPSFEGFVALYEIICSEDAILTWMAKPISQIVTRALQADIDSGPSPIPLKRKKKNLQMREMENNSQETNQRQTSTDKL